MKVYGYIRVSTKTQLSGNSMQSQEKDIKAYCKLCGLTLERIFYDFAISGTEFERDGLNSLLETIGKNDKSLIIVQSVDRLWRTESVMSKAKSLIKKTNSDVISIMQPLYSIYRKTDIIDKYNLQIDYSAEESRKEIVTKFAKARIVKAEHGNKPCGTAPYGYKWQGNNIVIDYNNNLIVQDIFSKYIELKSLGKLKDYCDIKGYKTSTGKDFSKQALKNIIENDFYIGVVTYAGNKVTGEHEPIVIKKMFEDANAILKR